MVALKHLKSQPVSLQAFAPKVSTATAYVINRALNKEPAERFQTYEEFIDHLEYARAQLLAGGGSRQKSRVILEDERSQQMMSWVTIGILAALIFGGVGLYFYRDKILGTEPKPITPAPHPTEAAIQADADYQNAIGMLAAGRTSDAAAAFQKVEATPDLPQPLRDWMTLQAGVSLLLDGRVEEAKPEFQKLVDLGPYSFDPAEEKLANFFPTTARAALGTDPIPAPAADDSKNNFEAMGWLAGAAKDSTMGDLADAEALYRKFESSSPEAPYDWLTKYHDLAGKRAAEIAAYRELEGKIKGATTVEQQKAVLPVVKEELTRPELKGRFAGQAASLVEGFEKQVTSGAEEQNQKMAAQDAEDAKVIAAAAAKFNALCREYKFAEAKAAMAAVQVGGEKGKTEKARLGKIAGWLDRFKERIISDLSASPAPGPITRLNGVPMEGNIVGGTDAQLQLSTKYGPVPLKWTELSFQTIYGMARRNIRTGLPQESLADREWDLGVFCWLMKQEREKKAMFDAAAAGKPDYQEETKAFEESGEAPAAKP
jgi:tetratricopeptide (TPR) repeat protein